MSVRKQKKKLFCICRSIFVFSPRSVSFFFSLIFPAVRVEIYRTATTNNVPCENREQVTRLIAPRFGAIRLNGREFRAGGGRARKTTIALKTFERFVFFLSRLSSPRRRDIKRVVTTRRAQVTIGGESENRPRRRGADDFI